MGILNDRAKAIKNREKEEKTSGLLNQRAQEFTSARNERLREEEEERKKREREQKTGGVLSSPLSEESRSASAYDLALKMLQDDEDYNNSLEGRAGIGANEHSWKSTMQSIYANAGLKDNKETIDSKLGTGATDLLRTAVNGTAIGASQNAYVQNRKSEYNKLRSQFGSDEEFEDAVESARLGLNKNKADPEGAAARVEWRAEAQGKLDELDRQINDIYNRHTVETRTGGHQFDSKDNEDEWNELKKQKEALEERVRSYDAGQGLLDKGDYITTVKSRMFSGEPGSNSSQAMAEFSGKEYDPADGNPDAETRLEAYRELVKERDRLDKGIKLASNNDESAGAKAANVFSGGKNKGPTIMFANEGAVDPDGEYKNPDGTLSGRTNKEALEELTAIINQYDRLWKPLDEYDELKQNPDFAQVVAAERARQGEWENADYVTRAKSTGKQNGLFSDAALSDEFKGSAVYQLSNYMTNPKDAELVKLTEDELDIYYYIKAKDGQEAADKYIDEMRNVLGQRANEVFADALENEGTLSKIFLNAVNMMPSTGANVASYFVNMGDILTGKEMSPYSGANLYGQLSDTLTASTGESLKKDLPWVNIFGQDAGKIYQGIHSGGVSGMLRVFGPGSVALMGLSAAAETQRELWERGASNDQIAVGGTLSGVAEAVFEYASLELLFKNFINSTPTGFRDFLLKGALQTFVEGSEEWVTEGANLITDFFVMHSQSEIEQMIKNYTDQGYSDSEAFGKAFWNDCIAGRMHDAFMGGVFGTMFSSGGSMVKGYSQARSAGSQIINQGADQTLRQMAEELADNEDLDQKKAEAIRKTVEKANAKPSAANVGYVFNAVEDAVNTGFGDNAEAAVKAGMNIMRSLEPTTDIRTAETSDGQTVTINEDNPIARFENGKAILNTSNGEMSVDDLSFADDAARLAYDNVNTYDVETANAVLNNYQSGDIARYLAGMREGIELHGKMNVPSEAVSYYSTLSEENQRYAKTLGQTMRQTIVDKAVQAAKTGTITEFKPDSDMRKVYEGKAKGAFGTKGAVYLLNDIGEDVAHFGENYDYLEAVADTTGAPVVFYDSNTVKNEQLKNANGKYVWKNGAIYVDINAGPVNGKKGLVAFALSHELTHFAEQWSPEDYKTYADWLVSTYSGKGGSMESLVKARMANEGTDYEEAYHDVIADFSERMLLDSDVLEKLEALREKDKTVWQKIVDKIRTLVNRIIGAYGDENQTYESNAIQDLLNSEELQKMKELWSTAVVEGAKNRAAAVKRAETRRANQNAAEIPTVTQFSMKAPVEQTKTMIAWHNISKETIDDAIELGGLAMPSFAIMPSDRAHSTYGGVSVIAYKNSIDPRRSSSQKIYAGDAWTPVFPEVRYKINADAASNLSGKVYDLLNKAGVKPSELNLALDATNITDRYDRGGGDFAKNYRDNYGMKLAFIEDTGRHVTVPTQEKQYTSHADIATLKKIAKAVNLDNLDSFGGYENEMTYEPILRRIMREYAQKKYGDTDGFRGQKLVDMLYPADEPMGFADVDRLFYAARQYMNSKETRQTDISKLEKRIDSLMQSKKVQSEYDEWLKNLGEGLVERKGIRNNKDLFTSAGNRRSWDALYDEYSLENIVRAMKGQPQQGRTQFLSGAGSVKGAALDAFESLEQVRSQQNRLVAELDDETEKAYDDFSENVKNLANKIADDPFTGSDMLADILSHAKTKEGIERYLRREYDFLRVQDRLDLGRVAEEIYTLGQEANTLPMEYFEAKVYRAFPFSEAAAVVVPQSLSRDSVEKLKEQGANVLTYKDGDNEDRLEKVNSVEGVRFSRKISPSDSARYLELAKDPVKNEAELSRMVEAAAEQSMPDSVVRDGNGNLLKVFHGTPNNRFNIFSYDNVGNEGGSYHGYGFYFTGNRREAQLYTQGKSDTVLDAYLSIQNPIIGNEKVSSAFLTELFDRLPIYAKNALAESDGSIEQSKKYYGNLEYGDLLAIMPKQAGMHPRVFNGILQDMGYDGEIYEDGESSAEYVVFSSSQIKSADPITYDDNGNVIPLEERFNPENEDIRYSRKSSLKEGEEFTTYILDGVNKETGEKVSFTDLIFDRLKLGETREVRNLPTGRWVGVAKDGKVVGRVKFGKPIEITKASPEYKDAYIEGTDYDIKPGETKWYYPIEDIQDFRNEPRAPKRWRVYDLKEGDRLSRKQTTSYSTRAVVERALKTLPEGAEKKALTEYKQTLDSYDAERMAYNAAVQAGDQDNVARAKNNMRTLSAKLERMENGKSLQNIAAVKDVKALNEDAKDLREMLRAQATETGGTVASRASAKLAADTLAERHNITKGKGELADLISELYTEVMTGVNNGAYNREQVLDMARSVSEWIAEKSNEEWEKANRKEDPEVKEVLNYIKGSRVRINENQKGDIRARYDGKLIKWMGKLSGYVRVANNATMTLDELWNDLSKEYPHIFDPNASDADQGVQLADIISDLKSRRYVTEQDIEPNTEEYEDNIRGISEEVINALWTVKPQLTIADRYAKKIESLREKHNERMRETRRTFEQTIREQREASWQRGKEVAEARQKRRELRTRIKALMTNLSNRLVNPKVGKYVPMNLQQPVAEVLSMIDTDTGRSERASAKLSALYFAYENIKNDPKYAAYRNVYDPAVSEMMRRVTTAVTEMEKVNAKYGRTGIYSRETEKGKSTGTVETQLSIRLLENLYEALKQFDTVIKDAVNIHGLGSALDETLTTQEVGEKLINEVRTENKNKSELRKRLLRGIHLTPDSFFSRLAGHKKDSMWSRVYKMIDNAQTKQLRIEMESNAIFREILKDQKYLRDITNTKKTYDVGLKDTNGKPVLLTKDMLLTLYKHLQNEDNTRHIIVGGMNLPNLNSYYKNRENSYNGEERMPGFVGEELAAKYKAIEEESEALEDAWEAAAVNNDQEKMARIEEKLKPMHEEADAIIRKGEKQARELLKNIEEQLDDKDRKFIEMSNEYFDEYSKNVLNEATMAMYGFEKAKVKNYFPIHVDSAFLKSSFDEIKKDFSLENSGFMKDRQKGASNPLYLEGFTTAVNQQIEKVARYAGLAPALKEFEKLYGVSTGGVTYNDSVKKAIGNVFGQAGTDYIEKLVADLNGNSRQKLQPWERFFQKARGRFAQGVLAVNAGVALKQRVSYLAAASELDYKSLTEALLIPEKGSFIFQGKQRRQNADELIAKWLPQLWKRSEGFIDVAMGEVRNVNQLRNRVNSKLNFLLGWIQASDISTVRRLWYASEYYVRDHTDLTPESDEYYRAVAEKYRDVIEKTQPNYTTLQRPALLRTNSEFIKSLTMFMTQRIQNFNIVYDSVLTANKYARDLKNKRNGVTKEDVHEARMRAYRAVSSQLGAAVGMAAINFLTGVMLFGRGKKWKDEDDEVTANSVLLGMLDDFLSSLCSNVVGGGEIYGIISSIVKGEKWKDGFSIGGLDTIEDAITSFSDALVKVRNGKELTSSDWIKIGGNVCTMFGIPGSNAYKLARGLKNNLEGTIRGMEVDGELWELGVTPDRTDDQNGRRMLNAFLEGNDEKFESLEAEFGSKSKAESAFKDALYEANRKGEITDDQVNDALEYIGYDDFDIGKVGEKWEGKDLSAREEELYNEWKRGMSFDEVVKTLADEGHELSEWDQHVLLGEWTAKKETGAKGNFVWSEELDEALEGYMRDTSTGSNMKSVIKQYREWGCEDSKLDDRVGYLFRDKYKAAYRESKTKAASIRGRIIVMLMECGRTEKKANDLVKQWEKDAAKK